MKNTFSDVFKSYALLPYANLINWGTFILINFVLITKLASFVNKLTKLTFYDRNSLETRYLTTLIILIAFNLLLGKVTAATNIYRKQHFEENRLLKNGVKATFTEEKEKENV